MCEHRELDVSGTKPQLAEALLQWRDKHCSEMASSPSSTGTARPPSTSRPRRRKTRSAGTHSPPVLERSDRVHLDEPRTPPLTSHNKEAEPELELDLESLGLDDREIPPEKLTKLEKIGSGGFKDVFIGKFKGRKVAIAEFRGQLNASTYFSIVDIFSALTFSQWTSRSSSCWGILTTPTSFASFVLLLPSRPAHADGRSHSLVLAFRRTRRRHRS